MRFMENWKYISVKEGLPAANKKGLRAKVTGMTFDENDVLREIVFEYSLYHGRGTARVDVSERNPLKIKGVQNG